MQALREESKKVKDHPNGFTIRNAESFLQKNLKRIPNSMMRNIS